VLQQRGAQAPRLVEGAALVGGLGLLQEHFGSGRAAPSFDRIQFSIAGE
jgi:hypothetical protein